MGKRSVFSASQYQTQAKAWRAHVTVLVVVPANRRMTLPTVLFRGEIGV